MSIQDLYNHTVSTERLANVVGSNKKTWGTNLASLDCTIHPVESTQQGLGDGAYYNTAKLWCDVDSDIRTGDRVIDGDNVYTVSGVSAYDFGRNPHLRATIVKGA